MQGTEGEANGNVQKWPKPSPDSNEADCLLWHTANVLQDIETIKRYDYTRTTKRDGRTQVGVEEVSLTSTQRK